ncbi:MAG: alginate export family protein [bacterium]|jgi:hypothetical protein|nr:alginate export family protein [bacterium]
MKQGLMLSVLALATLAQAADVAFDGQVRYRMENSNFVWSPAHGKFVPPFDSDVDAYNKAVLRTRLGATVTPQEGLKIHIQAQDSRTVGGSHGSSGTLAEDSKLGLHQGYFTWACQELSGLEIKAGRFEMPMADQRFFGAVDWNNVGRSFEGWKLGYTGLDLVGIHFYGLKVNEMAAANMDQTAWGLYFANILGRRIDLFYHNDDFGENAAEKKNVRSTIGLHYDNTYFDKLGVNFNFGTQMGTNEQGAADMDYAGMMYGLDASWELGLGWLDKVGFGYESMSGRDTSGDMTEWQELYPTAHKFHGYMDIAGPVYSGSTAGLNDIQVNFWGSLPLGLAYKLDYHMFSFVEDTGFEGNTDLGSEFDFSLAKKMGNFGVNLGYSMFTPTDNIAPGGDAQSWMYLMFTAGF